MGELFSALRYSNSTNLGDHIQTIAAMQFLPRVDYWVDRDDLAASAHLPPSKIIANGWYMHGGHLQYPDNLDPLYVSVHIAHDWVLDSDSATEHLRKHSPIGCRDSRTLERFQSRGIDAYLSRCLTLTFPRWVGPRVDEVLVVDIGDHSVIPPDLRRHAVALTHYTSDGVEKDARNLLHARALLDRYRMARLVITTRVHVALPCIAFGTPVIFIPPGYSADGRVRALAGLLPLPASREEIDWEPGLPPDVTEIAGRLRETCRAFIRRETRR